MAPLAPELHSPAERLDWSVKPGEDLNDQSSPIKSSLPPNSLRIA